MPDKSSKIGSVTGSGTRIVLFVDDEVSVLQALKQLFSDVSVMRLLTASSGEEALEIVRKEDVWLVVSDTNLPGISGIELLERIRHISPTTGRILTTAHADLKTAIDAINISEAFRFIIKPWDNDELKSIVLEALDRSGVVRDLAQCEVGAVSSIAQAIELKDPYTRGHCDRVAEYASTLAMKAGLPEESIVYVKYGGWLHDCGKIGVPRSVLNFPGSLDEPGMKIIHRHPLWGADVARQAGLPTDVVNMILYHHEKYDGSGYPYGLKGEEITLEARIVTIADVFDSLRTRRPYRAACTSDQVREIMREMSEAFFDPHLIELFQSIAEEVLVEDARRAATHHRDLVG
ncbi:MAG: response regulator [Desulfuromonadales bacterium]|nr:response regulator [Desulfuromonadales bacterium]